MHLKLHCLKVLGSKRDPAPVSFFISETFVVASQKEPRDSVTLVAGGEGLAMGGWVDGRTDTRMDG